MAVPHYAYLKLKMTGHAGVITVNGSFIKSDQCDRDFHEVSDTFGAQQQLEEIAMVTEKAFFHWQAEASQKKLIVTSALTVTQSPIKFTQRTRTRRSMSTPTSQKNKQLPSWLSSVKSGKFSSGARPTCQEYRENLQNTRYTYS